MVIKNGRTVWKHAPGVYRRHTVFHPAHALALFVLAVLGALTYELLAMLVGLLLLEALVVMCLPRLPRIRRAVDARIEGRARAKASAARSELLLRMSDEHRRELLELEQIAATIRERCGTGVHDCLSIERLIELYVRFAIAHRVTAALLEAAGRARPDEAIAQLEQRVDVAGALVRESVESRLEILRMRCEARRAAREQQLTIAHELAAIGDTLRWMQEQCAAASNDALHAELRAVVADRAQDAETLRELSTLRDDRFDPEVLPLGRDPDPSGHLEPRLRVVTDRPEQHDDSICAIAEPLLAMAARRM